MPSNRCRNVVCSPVQFVQIVLFMSPDRLVEYHNVSTVSDRVMFSVGVTSASVEKFIGLFIIIVGPVLSTVNVVEF